MNDSEIGIILMISAVAQLLFQVCIIMLWTLYIAYLYANPPLNICVDLSISSSCKVVGLSSYFQGWICSVRTGMYPLSPI